MSELNINNLPAEMLTELFRYLNEGNWRNATMTCKLWNHLIKFAFRWSLKLEYDEHDKLWSKNRDDGEPKMDFILTTNRKFGTIEIYGGRLGEDDRILQIFKRHGSNVVELYLEKCRVDNLTGFAELLTFTPHLKHVTGVQIEVSHSSSDVLLDQLLPDLKKLQSLVIYGSDYRIIKCLLKARLTTMEIWDNYRSENHSLLVDFLSIQDTLTSLTVDSQAPLVEIGKRNVIPFRLTHLSISGITCQKPSQAYDNAVRFIKSQAEYLTEIQMNFAVSSSVYECVFANMTNVTTLSVKINEIPKDNDFYDRFKENFNVHTVALLGTGMLDDQFVGKFLQKLPKVRCLIARNINGFWINNTLVMAQCLRKLESLYVGRIYRISLDCVNYPNLMTLHILHLRSKMCWNELTKIHPLLTELTIERMDKASYLTTDDIDQITTNIDLQHITLGVGFVADNRFFEIVASKCTNLKVLDLDKSCISQELEHYLKVDVLRLRDSVRCLNFFRSRLLA